MRLSRHPIWWLMICKMFLSKVQFEEDNEDTVKSQSGQQEQANLIHCGVPANTGACLVAILFYVCIHYSTFSQS